MYSGSGLNLLASVEERETIRMHKHALTFQWQPEPGRQN